MSHEFSTTINFMDRTELSHSQPQRSSYQYLMEIDDVDSATSDLNNVHQGEVSKIINYNSNKNIRVQIKKLKYQM